MVTSKLKITAAAYRVILLNSWVLTISCMRAGSGWARLLRIPVPCMVSGTFTYIHITQNLNAEAAS